MPPKVTQHTFPYPQGYAPDNIEPANYSPCRFALGKLGAHPLVVICMNPSAAEDTLSDMTVNRIIKIGQALGMDGWMIFNTYPERATNAKSLSVFDQSLCQKNLTVIEDFLREHNITEVWGAWGNADHPTLTEGKNRLISLLKNMGIKVYYFGTLTKSGNPRHPLQRYEKWDLSHKHYLEI